SQANTYWYRSTDYVRLKNVQLGYTLPPELVSKVSLGSARIYVNAVNLITWDQFDVFDPETDNQDGTVYPQKRVYNVGVSLTFYPHAYATYTHSISRQRTLPLRVGQHRSSRC